MWILHSHYPVTGGRAFFWTTNLSRETVYFLVTFASVIKNTSDQSTFDAELSNTFNKTILLSEPCGIPVVSQRHSDFFFILRTGASTGTHYLARTRRML